MIHGESIWITGGMFGIESGLPAVIGYSLVNVKKEADKFIRKEQIFIAADKESYEIGYVAGLILDEKNPNWKENFYVTGKGIPEVLLENVIPIPDEPDKKTEGYNCS